MDDDIQRIGFRFDEASQNAFDTMDATLKRFNLKLKDVVSQTVALDPVTKQYTASLVAQINAVEQLVVKYGDLKNAEGEVTSWGIQSQQVIQKQSEGMALYAKEVEKATLAAEFFARQQSMMVELNRARAYSDAGTSSEAIDSGRTLSQGDSDFIHAEQQRIRDEIEATGAVIKRGERGYNEFQRVAEKSHHGVLLSWQTMVRLMEIQILHNLITQIVQGVIQGAREAEQFSIRIGEIMTISQRAPLAFNAWSESIRRLSDTFGKDLLDVAKGVYETLSNNIGQGTTAIDFMNEALKFSITTVSSAKNSVDLLSGALNAYHMTAEDTAKVSASFFKTIDLGRVTADEMANSIGRVLPLAASLGVSLDETNASLATLTITGMKFSEASTLMTNLMTKLLKPSEQMKAIFKEWGVSGAEAAIATFGWSGVLKKLETAANGSSTEMADMLKNIRAIRAALGLTGDAFDLYTQNLSKIKKATTDYNNAFNLVQSTPGQQLAIEMQKVKNLFTVEFGEKIIEDIVAISKSLGGLTNGIREITYLGKALIESFLIFKAGGWLLSGVSTLSTYFQVLRTEGVATGAAIAGSMQEMFAAIGPAGWVMLGLTAITYGYEKWSEQQEYQLHLEEHLRDEFAQTSQEYVAGRQKMMDALDSQIQQETDHLFQGLGQAAADSTRYINTIIDADAAAFDKATEALKLRIKTTAEESTKVLQKMEEDQRKIQENIQNAEKDKDRASDAAEKMDRQNQLADAANDPVKQVQILAAAAEKLKTEMQAAFNNNNLAQAEKKSSEISTIYIEMAAIKKKALENELSLTEKINSAGATEDQKNKLKVAEANVARLRAMAKAGQKNPELENAIQQLKALRESIASINFDTKAAKLNADLDKAKATSDAIAKIFSDNTAKQFGDSLNAALTVFIGRQQVAAAKAAQDAESYALNKKVFDKTLEDIGNFKVVDKEGKLKFKTVQEAQTKLDEFVANAEKAGLQKGTALWTQVQNFKAQIALQIQDQMWTAMAKKDEEGLAAAKQRLTRLKQDAIEAQGGANKNVGNSLTDFQIQAGLLQNLIGEGQAPGWAGSTTPTQELEAKLIQALKDLKTNPQSASYVARLAKQYQTMMASGATGGNAQADGYDGEKWKGDYEHALNGKFTDQNGVLVSLSELLTNLNNSASGVDAANKKAREAEKAVHDLEIAIKDLDTRLSGIPATTESALQAVKRQASDTIKEINRISDAIRNLNFEMLKSGHGNPYENPILAPMFLPSGTPRMFPGPQLDPTPAFASGGIPGTDSMLAYVNPNEMIMNESATHTFAAQLSAMNSVRPQHIESGSTNIGDVHIHGVPVSGNTTVDARQMAKQFRKEIRRGNIRSFADDT